MEVTELYYTLWTHKLEEYSELEIERIKADAWSGLARTPLPEHRLLPHVITLAYGVDKDFEIGSKGFWIITCYVFKNIVDYCKFLGNEDPDKFIEINPGN